MRISLIDRRHGRDADHSRPDSRALGRRADRRTAAVGPPPPRTLSLVLELRIDAADADLSPVGWIAVAKDGTIAVGQSQDHLIRCFDARGASLGTFGRDGAGPGEFRYLTIQGWLGDTLWVSDVGVRRRHPVRRVPGS